MIEIIDQVFQLGVLLALVSGSLLGILVGAIPGLGPGVAIVLLLPLTFELAPLIGITLLMGVYAGAWYGGAIPAILLNTPGTAVNVLTTYDGYPMTQRGEGRRALSLAYAASFFGGTFSVLALILLAPTLANFAKLFGAADLATAAMLALVLVVTAHRGNQLGAAAMLGAGLFLSTIGLEGAYGTQRYTFDQTWLLGGIPLVVVVLGLYAISQSFILIAAPQQAKHIREEEGISLFAGFTEVLRYPRTLLRSSSFGVSMGILPGVGEFLAQFLSYTCAKRFSKAPEQFGKGAPEGIIASESANNAVPAAALVPLLALGIPGEVLTAMMLSVFMIHNVVPGPALFTEQASFVHGLYACLLLMNLVIVAFLICGTKWISRVSLLDERKIGIVVLCLAMIGTYTVNYSLVDPLIAVVLGLIGLALRRASIPTVPLILGLVLGPIIEARFRQAMGGSGGDPMIFLERPISAAFFAIMALLIISSLLSIKNKEHPKKSPTN